MSLKPIETSSLQAARTNRARPIAIDLPQIRKYNSAPNHTPPEPLSARGDKPGSVVPFRLLANGSRATFMLTIDVVVTSRSTRTQKPGFIVSSPHQILVTRTQLFSYPPTQLHPLSRNPHLDPSPCLSPSGTYAPTRTILHPCPRTRPSHPTSPVAHMTRPCRWANITLPIMNSRTALPSQHSRASNTACHHHLHPSAASLRLSNPIRNCSFSHRNSPKKPRQDGNFSNTNGT